MVYEGDLCPKCKKGRIALADALISHVTPDQEPFENGKEEEIEGCSDGFELDDNIQLTVHACHNCGHITSVETQQGYWDRESHSETTD